uniref:Aldehyde dehydrogenase domain-containing protein n=1 Tax=Mucochytrium quahogii TaxID=96639 RepID=A0A7S2WIA2_9STRA|mmetsp:Transcript_11225/g.20869  ORF Transcript_11225/g.20869 Transcript_11225/m.20869 type:complete len:489 (-) Transcript_11225:43-1509(-)|eukprot:CAMPEP_0203751618 /NCGR_PEP_ID=MMETSP0098-20131031/5665_1 /ASSEMBLY_ACC=CAM_ASM_000208 /TAXON_ID=96639 /ORGANISM=" , Strain NY0313808BC1" /LENGTH=488 /DNA_ID=CAMNT_0050641421 /DNA_START=782 /DNA_END=2248 /DNA_ORIENTATION=+
MLLIDGQLRQAEDGQTLKVVNPFSEQVITSVAKASEQDVDRAVMAADAAKAQWRNIGGKKRATYLVALADEIEKNKKHLSEIETQDCGKPFPESEWDVDDCVACLKYYAGLAVDLEENKQNVPVDVGDTDYECSIRYEPAGVACCIIPWNYPLLMAIWKIGPALASGCTVVLKPSENTPLTAIELAKISIKVQLPAGVLNILTGDGAAGAALVNHPKTSVVAFTGSVPTGIKVAEVAAPHVKQVTLELGGKSAALVFPDADLDKAAEWVCFGCWWTNGQICSATSRLLVHEEIADIFIKKLETIGKSIKMGDPMDPDCRLGPVVNGQQQEKVLSFINKAQAQGAQLLLGSGRKPTEKGYFVEPTILKVDSSTNIAWEEEIFGPVLTVKTFSTDDMAIQLANDSKFGLAGAVFSKDKARLARCSNELNVGIVWTNCSQPCFCQLPWGGRQQSGYGRDLGEFGLSKFLEPKQVVNYVSSDPLGWYDTSKL